MSCYKCPPNKGCCFECCCCPGSGYNEGYREREALRQENERRGELIQLLDSRCRMLMSELKSALESLGRWTYGEQTDDDMFYRSARSAQTRSAQTRSVQARKGES